MLAVMNIVNNYIEVNDTEGTGLLLPSQSGVEPGLRREAIRQADETLAGHKTQIEERLGEYVLQKPLQWWNIRSRSNSKRMRQIYGTMLENFSSNPQNYTDEERYTLISFIHVEDPGEPLFTFPLEYSQPLAAYFDTLATRLDKPITEYEDDILSLQPRTDFSTVVKSSEYFDDFRAGKIDVIEFKHRMKEYFYALDVEIRQKYLSSAAMLRTISYETPTLF